MHKKYGWKGRTGAGLVQTGASQWWPTSVRMSPWGVLTTCPPLLQSIVNAHRCATHLPTVLCNPPSSVTPPFTPLLPTSPQSIQMPLCNPPLLSEERHSQYFATFYGITEEHTWEMKLPHKTDHVAGKVEISGRGGEAWCPGVVGLALCGCDRAEAVDAGAVLFCTSSVRSRYSRRVHVPCMHHQTGTALGEYFSGAAGQCGAI